VGRAGAAARALQRVGPVRLVIHIVKSFLRFLMGPETTPSALPMPVPVTSSAVRALWSPPGHRCSRFQ